MHPFNDLTLATGQGTIAYEIFQDLPDVDVILVPIGGGGLAAGVATLAKLLNPHVEVIAPVSVSTARKPCDRRALRICSLWSWPKASVRGQHGCDYHVLPGAARADPARTYLYLRVIIRSTFFCT